MSGYLENILDTQASREHESKRETHRYAASH
jgi:hypothetical protein